MDKIGEARGGQKSTALAVGDLFDLSPSLREKLSHKLNELQQERDRLKENLDRTGKPAQPQGNEGKLAGQRCPTVFPLLFFIAIQGCGDVALGPNQEIQIQEDVEFYLNKEFDFGNIDPKTGLFRRKACLLRSKRAIIEGAEWIVPEGVSIYEPDLKIVQTKLHWGEYRGGRQYTKSVEGYRLTTSCRVKIGEDAQPGEHTLLLRLPALEQLGVFPSLIHSENRSDTKGAVKVKSFTVRGP